MSSLQRRGQRVLLALIAIVIVHQCSNIWLAASEANRDIHTYRTLGKSLSVAAAAAFLWRGETWLVRLMIFYFIFSGVADLVVAGKLMSAVFREAPPDARGLAVGIFARVCGMLAAVGLLHLIAGLILWRLPSVRAYFALQRGAATIYEI